VKHITNLCSEAIKLLEPKLPVLYPHLEIKIYQFGGDFKIEFKPKRYNTLTSKNTTTITNNIGKFRFPFESVNANIIECINRCIENIPTLKRYP
jgi:hypothetical protein